MGIDAGDFLISAGLGAAEGWAKGQAKENADAKEMAQMERKAQLLLLKDKRQQAWEERKMGMEHENALELEGVKNTNKQNEAQLKRSQDLFDAEQKNTFELEKLDKEYKYKSGEAATKHGYDVELERIKNEGRGNKRSGLTEMQQYRLESDLAKLEDEGVSEMNVNRVNAIRKKLGEPLYRQVKVKEGEPGGLFGGKKEPVYEYQLEEDVPATDAQPKPPPGSKFTSIFQKVTRVKQGANDGVEEPAPLPGTY